MNKQAQVHKHFPGNREISIDSYSVNVVNSSVSLLRFHPLSFFAHPQNDYIGKSMPIEPGSKRAWGIRDGRKDDGKMKTGDY